MLSCQAAVRKGAWVARWSGMAISPAAVLSGVEWSPSLCLVLGP